MKWLIVRYSAIGDCVMCTHVASRIRRQLPEAHIGWWIDESCAPILDMSRLCNDRYTVNRGLWKQNRWSSQQWVAALRTFSQARRMKYDVGMDLHGHMKTALCLRISNPKIRLALKATDSFSKKLNPIARPPDPQTHWVDWTLAALSEVLESSADPSPIMPQFDPVSSQFSSIFQSGKPTVLISVTAGKWDTTYPAERWKQVGKELLSSNCNVVFVGGSEGKSVELAGAHDLIGKTTLRQTMELISKSDLCLAADTGVGHLAAAYQIPAVSVFGPTNSTAFRPYTTNGIVLQETKNIRSVSADQVFQAAKELLSQYGKKISN